MPHDTKNFESAYQKLNNKQRLAVDTIEGPVLVLAGPGTGKTQVLTTRIANILKQTDTDPSSILALTFTEAATREMRQRLIKMIGKDGYFVQVTTFHGFCNDIIASNPDRFSRPAGMQNVTDLEKIQIIKQILEEGDFQLLKPINSPLHYLNDLIGSISTLKREGFTIPRFRELVSILKDEFEIKKDDLNKTTFAEKQKQVIKNLDLLDIYEKYQNQLTSLGRFDFDDMINWVVDSFEKDNDFLLEYQEKFQYILVDEYQDTNSSQNRLIFALASFWGQQANLFAVGDPNQSVYRFQGASKENLVQFKNIFPEHTHINLDQNYRSTKTILDISAKLIDQEPLSPNIDLKDLKLKTAKFSSSLFEDEYIVSAIETKIKEGVSPKDIAVIAKENKDIENLVSLFKVRKIPFRLEAGTNVLLAPCISQFIKLLKVVTTLQDKMDDLDLFTVLNYSYLQLDPLILLKTSRQAYLSRQSLADTIIRHCESHSAEAISQPVIPGLTRNPSPSLRGDADDVAIQKVFKTVNQFILWNSQSMSKSLPEIFQIILQGSGLLNHLLALPESLIELNRFNTLYEDVKKQSSVFPDLSLKKYLQNLQIMQDNHVKLEEQVLEGMQDAVTLTTAHKSKGLEWQIVFVYRFADTHWGNKTRKEMIKLPPGIIVFENTDTEEDKNSEERRLFYVALTRAKQEITLTGSTVYQNSTKMTYPSIFLEDLPKELIEEVDTSVLEKSTAKIIENSLTPATDTVLVGEEEYLKELLKDFKLSPTALNTYLSCHYKFKLDNLYRIPRSKAPSMCFGTAVHFALENLYQNLDQDKLISQLEFLQSFEVALKREILSPTDFKDRRAHGKRVLTSYYEANEKDFQKVLFTEKSFGTSLASQIHLDDIALTGKADRIDLIDKKENTVRFVDYKTGKPKSRNEIEGNTQSSNGDYKRQLVFYRLLAELDKSFPYKVDQTEIDFVEPNEKGEFKKERFSITTEEVENLKTLIKESVASIRALDFTPTTDIDTCSTCPFFSHCWPDK
ncbi:hypothetical protein A2572_01980 [Candidatus Collierbacteria bacterium RIFOXYD1_FULL_40_9]|uniref:DNA 3'-5' helicase n=1 Tax=Candidatus Collierbacteria bacterium RIFOXYD1_FULL_40_9 TaxID=1817731 RepID=A0A1F5FTB2_9BACT|nr:MAG: hypothetical protein A2572_01980 [Candidatus Collierbacteria bacterium RIFOXYD1_FULL_40_9]